MDDATRQQIAAQCKAVAHLARAIAWVYDDYAAVFNGVGMPTIAETVGRRSAYLMETLGNILNGMDAVGKEDAWMDPIFEEAQRRWPAHSATEGGGT
jgi:hypothetical protein